MSKRGKGRRGREDSDEESDAVTGMLAALEVDEGGKRGKKEAGKGGKGKKRGGKEVEEVEEEAAERMAAQMAEGDRSGDISAVASDSLSENRSNGHMASHSAETSIDSTDGHTSTHQMQETSSFPRAIKTAQAIETPTEEVPVTKGKTAPEKKTKLQLKLEALAKEKERLDKERAVKEAEQMEQEKRLEQERQQQLKLEQEKLEREKAERDAAEKIAEEAREAAAEESQNSQQESVDSAVPEDSDVVPATMFGDEVVKEYGETSQQPSELEMKQLSGKKLSNKDKRRLAKEQEAKEREAEYNRAALKASMEGAQFAVSQSIINEDDPQWQNALDIIIPSVTISAHNKELLNNSELNIVHGRRYGLVGPNGAGKSTLLKMIASKELKIPPRVDVLYVEQEVIADDTPAVDAVLKADKERWSLIQEEKQLLKELEKGPDESKDVRLGEIYEQLAQIGGSAAESRARRILYGLGFDGEMQERATRFFSGGWRMRISLARALFMEPTLLMLDEPTNHLDLNAGIH